MISNYKLNNRVPKTIIGSKFLVFLYQDNGHQYCQLLYNIFNQKSDFKAIESVVISSTCSQ